MRNLSDDTQLDDAALIEQSIRRAGAFARSFSGRQFRRWTKGDNSPVSEADIAVSDMLEQRLCAARPGYGWICEENAKGRAQSYPSSGRCFVVDPIDGTRNFLNDGDCWTVSIAIVEAGIPVDAAIFCPPRGEFYAASAGQGATRNGARLQPRNVTQMNGVRYSGPRSLRHHPALSDHNLVPTDPVPSLAHRLARLAAGEFELALTTARACHWDIAAADLMLRETEMALHELDSGPPRYSGQGMALGPLIAAPHTLLARAGAIFGDALRQLTKTEGRNM